MQQRFNYSGLISMLLIAGLTPTCSAAPLKPGFYGMDRVQAIFDAEKEANRKIWCEELDRIDIGVRGKNFSPFYFSRDELRKFFNDEKQKDFIVVLFHPLCNWGDNVYDDEAAKAFTEYFFACGYKRCLFAHASGNGYFVIRDISQAASDTSTKSTGFKHDPRQYTPSLPKGAPLPDVEIPENDNISAQDAYEMALRFKSDLSHVNDTEYYERAINALRKTKGSYDKELARKIVTSYSTLLRNHYAHDAEKAERLEKEFLVSGKNNQELSK